ncbi:molybdopterin cofactor-binding domain-containing protein [Sedimentitalea sp. XS_ASV28]|uniref:xanthine dehydrogenase family protein molybdopterin-binding subunit n=1 Tax=Sedimentitalea sp. XS_ASV28 TaxID=3241296 RepID=UPI003511AE80
MTVRPNPLRSPERVEDAALLTGRAQFMDDLPEPGNCLHLAILRASEAHALITALDTAAARALPGVVAVLTGADVAALTRPLMVGVRLPMECWPIAQDRVRYVGEPVVLVVARSRYIAEDALAVIDVHYDKLPAVVAPRDALGGATVLHDSVGSNLVSERSYRYGDPEAAFAEAAHRVEISVSYPRNAVTPIECYGLIAAYDPFEQAFDVTANFQGPFSIHSVIARALQVPGNRLRLRTPPASGGSYGVKQGIFPYIVLASVAARVAGAPVKWVEDRLEHLTASVSATNRETTLAAAVDAHGRVTALDWDQLEDVGAYIRAPEPATLYRMHGNMCGAYDIQNLSIRNRVVVTNKTPTGLVRGFGGPQVYFALERLMQRIAATLDLDPLDVIARNLIPADAFPYRTASGALYDSGDYQQALEIGRRDAGLAELLDRRKAAQAEGRLYGVGYAVVVEPSVSNMGYVSTVLTREERAKSGPKNGAQATATIALDPLGSVSVHVASAPQGQGHRTVLAGVVGEVLGLPAEAVQVRTDLDTGKDAWSIASGNYSSRFAAAVAGTGKLAATRMRVRLAAIAAPLLGVSPDEVQFADGMVSAKGAKPIPFARLAATSHWAPGTVPDGAEQALRETVYWTPPQLEAPDEADRVNSSLCHGFIFDFCGVEIDRLTGALRIDRYVTVHDCGRILHQGMVDGQIRGGYANAIGAALYEEYAYNSGGAFLTGTFADYLVPTVAEVPAPEIHHLETPSPFTPLGAKGVGEGNCMSTPVCLANAASDALGAGILTLPMTPARLRAVFTDDEAAAPEGMKPAAATSGRGLSGAGEVEIDAPRQTVWNTLLDPETLERIVPGCHAVKKITDTHFRADVTLGVGPVKGRYTVDVKLSDLVEPQCATLSGGARGALGSGEGAGRVMLEETPGGGTRMRYDYEAQVGGKVAAVGGRMLDGAAKVVIGQFFRALASQTGGGPAKSGLFDWLMFWRRS